MGKIIKVRLTEYYPFQEGLTEKQQRMEGGKTDRRGKPLYPLEDYLEGKAPYVSLACDYKGGLPSNTAEFRIYGYKVELPAVAQRFGRTTIEFRLVDTGQNFYGEKKKVRVAGHEPIDVCRKVKPAKEDSISTLLTELVLVGKS